MFAKMVLGQAIIQHLFPKFRWWPAPVVVEEISPRTRRTGDL